jgi:hypothetical protein
MHYPTDFSVSHTVITATQRHRTLEKRMCAPVLIQWVSGAFSAIKQQGLKVNHSLSSSAEVKNK